MRLEDVFSITVFVITVASCALADDPLIENELSVRQDRRMAKRDAAIFIDNFPIEPIYRSDPNIIYKRISRRRYKPKPKYGPPKYGPPKPKYGPPKSMKTRKPIKKYKKPSSQKYGPPSRKKRPTKPRYGPPSSYKPVYGPPKKSPVFLQYSPEPVDFGEPPESFGQGYESLKPTFDFGEPPVEYGVPLNAASDLYTQAYEPASDYEIPNYTQDLDYQYTKKRPVFLYTKPEPYVQNVEEIQDDMNANSDFYKLPQEQNPIYEKKKRNNGKKKSKKPTWKPTPPNKDEDQEILVGGQYAEPPARYVPKLAPSASFYSGDEFSPVKFYMDPDEVSSATISSYVNYKNSNMAFSPQNLNDAFSIVET